MNPSNALGTALKNKGHQLLLLAIMLLLLVSPFILKDSTISWLSSIILMLVLLAAAYTVRERVGNFHITLLLGIPALLSQIAEFVPHGFWLETIRYTVTAMFLFWVCYLLLKDILLRMHSVNMNLVIGSVNVYLMLGIGFALVFTLIEHLQPGSFKGLEEFAVLPDQIPIFLYFSFITMTTLGYGDISPDMPHAMTASYLLAIMGQLYLAIFVARLVALYIKRPSGAD